MFGDISIATSVFFLVQADSGLELLDLLLESNQLFEVLVVLHQLEKGQPMVL